MYRRYLTPWLGSVQGPLHEAATAVPAAGAGGGGSPSGGAPSGGSPSPTVPSGSGSSPAGASGQPGAGGGSPASPANTGPVAYERFDEVNKKYGALSWAESYDKDTVEQATRLYQWFDQDPQGAYEYLTGLMKRQGHLPATAAQPPARTQPTFRADPNTGRPLPDRFIQETGEQLYSGEQTSRLIDWAVQRLEDRLKPLEAASQGYQARSEAQQHIAEAEANWPFFKEHVEAIFSELNKDRRLSLEGAYRRVVVPKIRTLERDAVLKEMQTRSTAGSGSVNPGSQAAPVTEDLTKLPLRELLRREMTKRGFTRG